MRAIAAREDELLRKWWDARILESAAKTELERIIARERTLHAEMAIAWERDKATRLGEGLVRDQTRTGVGVALAGPACG